MQFRKTNLGSDNNGNFKNELQINISPLENKKEEEKNI